MVIDSGLLHDAVGGVPRFGAGIDREIFVGTWTMPNFMIALALSNKVAAVLFQHVLNLRREGAGHLDGVD